MDKKASVLKILPVKKEDEKPSILNPILPVFPSCTCIVGPPRSSKSTLVMNLLCNPNFYYCGNENDPDNPSFFDEVYYLSPTSKFDRTTKNVLSKMDNVIQIDDMDELQDTALIVAELQKSQKEWDEEKEGKPRPKILICYDDMVDLLVKTKVDILSTKFRHYNFSVICISQSYKKLPPVLRNCMTAFIFFNLMSEKEFVKVYEEHGQSIPGYWEHIKILNKKYQFLYYNIENQELYHNFEKLLWSKDQMLEDGKGYDEPDADTED